MFGEPFVEDDMREGSYDYGVLDVKPHQRCYVGALTLPLTTALRERAFGWRADNYDFSLHR